MMKIFTFFLFWIACFTLQAQKHTSPEFQQALQLIQQAREHAHDAAEQLGFYEGSADFNEIKYHLYESRIAMDSLLVYTQKTEYKVTDASYVAEDLKEADLQERAKSIKILLKVTSTKLLKVMKEIDLVFTNTPYNLDTYLYKPFQEFNQIQQQLLQIEQKLISAHKLQSH